MSAKKSFRVCVIAEMNEREQLVLTSLTRLTTARLRSYTFEPPSDALPDIYLVDGDNPDMLARWHVARARHAAPVVFLHQDIQTSPEKRMFRRPLVPSCMLNLVNVFDDITVKDLRFLPELSIGEAAPYQVEPGAIKPASRTRHTALVVDDSPTVRAQIGMGLQMYGVSADFAETAEEALKLLASNSYDIAFLDVVLPGSTDGNQICKAIKRDQKSKQTIVVILTGKSSAFDRVKASLAGCNTFLTKPVENDVFQKVLQKYLGGDDATFAAQTAPAK